MMSFEALLKAPQRIVRLPRNEAGYPIPWFVHVDPLTGKADFRVIGEGKIAKAYNQKLCWICGDHMGKFKTFVIGPMCAVNRISSEPPSHLECAKFAAEICPFLSNPKKEYRETNLPEGHQEAVGIPIKRNPGVTLLWTTLEFRPMKVERGYLFQLGHPTAIDWMALGKMADRLQVLEALNAGFPVLTALAMKEGPEAMKELNFQFQQAMKLIPLR